MRRRRKREYNSAEGRTKRIEKMYNEMGIGGCDEDYYLIKDAKLNEDTNWDKDDYKRYLKETYNINVDVQDFKLYSYSTWIQTGNIGSGYGNSMVIFKTKGKWFFGGVVSRGLNDPYQLIPADTKYSGEIIE